MSDPPTPPRLSPRLEDFPAAGAGALAGFGQRAVARVFDTMLIAFPVMVVIGYLAVGEEPEDVVVPWWVLLGGLVVGVGYEVAMVAWRGQTLGKLLVGLRIARYRDGGTPSITQATQRILLPDVFAIMANSFLRAVWIVIYLSSSFDPMGRGWHDKYAGTIVVRTR